MLSTFDAKAVDDATIAAIGPVATAVQLDVRDADAVSSRINPSTPLLVVSGRASELDRVRGLEAGADDYLAKPFNYHELRLRVAALLRRPMPTGVRYDAADREFVLPGSWVPLGK